MLAVAAFLAGAGALLVQSTAAEESYAIAERYLEEGNAAEAESAAREALARSLRFVPEEEIEARPDKGLLFEDMILQARARYRARRERYFRLLGDALTSQERYEAARKAYRRAPGVASLLAMAEHPDVSVEDRVVLLLEAYLRPESDRAALEKKLIETGAFRNRHALDASFDRRRFGTALRDRFGELELLPEAFPNASAVTDAGTLVSQQLFQTGSLLVIYRPVGGCGRCSEELDGLTVPVETLRRGGVPIEVVAFVGEVDLPVARRIVRLLAMPVGVGRADTLTEDLGFLDSGEIRVVGRGGLLQIRMPMSSTVSSGEIRPRVEAVFDLLADTTATKEQREQKSHPLVTLERGSSEPRTFSEWIDRLDRLEAGPAPLQALYAELGRLVQRLARGARADRALGFELLQSLSRLEGAHTAKTRALELVGDRVGETLLERARLLDPTVRRTAPGTSGVFHVAVDARRIYLQRSYQTTAGLRHFDFVLEESGSDVTVSWAGAVEGPSGVARIDEGAVFGFEGEGDCRGLKLVANARVVHESCKARIFDGRLVEARPALVDAIENPPLYFRRDVTGEAGQTALERGLRAFEAGDFAEAISAFERAVSEVDEDAPYDASDLVYNRARALESQGKRGEALELYRSLGDVSYQEVVDARANAIETGR